MSDACVSGVYAASGIAICTSQLKYVLGNVCIFFFINITLDYVILGLAIPRYEDPFSVIQTWWFVLKNLGFKIFLLKNNLF